MIPNTNSAAQTEFLCKPFAEVHPIPEILKIPNELLFKTAEFLNESDLVSLGSVSKDFRRVFESDIIWTKFLTPAMGMRFKIEKLTLAKKYYFEQEFNFYNSTMTRYINSGMLTNDQVSALTKTQRTNLSRPMIYNLLTSKKFTQNEVLSLNQENGEILASSSVYSLITSNQMTKELFFQAHSYQLKNLQGYKISNLLSTSFFTIEEALNSSTKVIEYLNGNGYSKCLTGQINFEQVQKKIELSDEYAKEEPDDFANFSASSFDSNNSF